MEIIATWEHPGKRAVKDVKAVAMQTQLANREVSKKNDSPQSNLITGRADEWFPKRRIHTRRFHSVVRVVHVFAQEDSAGRHFPRTCAWHEAVRSQGSAGSVFSAGHAVCPKKIN